MESPATHVSPRVRTLYFKALTKLSEQLDQTWKRVLPPDARLPLETCEVFFEPFCQFGVALYDAYAEELINSTRSEEHYLQALNFDLKTLVCNQIAPWKERPVRTLQDAVEADDRGEAAGEWTLRMGESWRLFEHPRQSRLCEKVKEHFIDALYVEPGRWDQLFGRVHKAISRRVPHWLAAHAEATETSPCTTQISLAPQSGGTKKRGRPQTIPDERKQAALAQKREGGTNRDAAKALYGVRFPTPQQVRNVPSILRYHEGKLKNSREVAPSGVKASRKINKNRG